MTTPINRDQLDEVLWKVQTSLLCTVRWLEAGCDPKEAAAELRLNIDHLQELRAVGAAHV